METSTGQPFTREGRAGQESNSHAFRARRTADAVRVHDLVARCPPLDANSLYCNLLQCSHFSETCVVAERNGDLHGWVSGYIRPDRPDVLFVWQVAVAPEMKAATAGVTRLALVFALSGSQRVFSLVILAWSTLACAFGPLIALPALRRRVNQVTTIALMALAVGIALWWRQMGWQDIVYEGLPGMLAPFILGWFLSVPRSAAEATDEGDTKPAAVQPG